MLKAKGSLNEEIKIKLNRTDVLLLMLCINIARNHTKGGSLLYDLEYLWKSWWLTHPTVSRGLIATNKHQIIMNSGEGYNAKASAMGGINLVKENAPKATVEDKTAWVEVGYFWGWGGRGSQHNRLPNGM